MKKIMTKAVLATALASTLLTSCSNKEVEKKQAAEIADLKNQLAEAQEKIKTLTPPDTHFRKVTKHLDYDGDFFNYSKIDNTQEIIEAGLAVVAKFGQIAITPEAELAKFNDGMNVLREFIKETGAYAIDASASSAIPQDDYFHNKTILHASKTDGTLFKLLGGEAHDLTSQKLLPQNTLLALSGDIKLDALWQSLNKVAAKSSDPQVQGAPMMATAFTAMMGVDFEQLLKEQSGELGVFITSDLKETMTVPIEGKPVEIPKAAIHVLLARKGSIIDGLIAKQLPPDLAKETIGDFTLTNLPPMPNPLGTQPAFATSKDFFVVSSDIDALRTSLKSYQNNDGLISTPEFKKQAKNIPTQGNGYTYISPKIVGNLIDVTLKAIPEKNRKNVETVLAKVPNNIFYYGVNQVQPYGIQSTNNFTFRNDTLNGGALEAITYTSILSSMLFPTFGKMQRKAKANNQANNLKQVGITVASYFCDIRKKSIPADLGQLARETNSDLTPIVLSTFNDSGVATHGVNGDIVFLAGGKNWMKVNSDKTVLAYIDYPNKEDMISLLFGDGHVETFTGSFDYYCELNPNCLPE